MSQEMLRKPPTKRQFVVRTALFWIVLLVLFFLLLALPAILDASMTIRIVLGGIAATLLPFSIRGLFQSYDAFVEEWQKLEEQEQDEDEQSVDV